MTARLSLDRISADPERSSRSAPPSRWMYLLHGIYGAGRNWSSVARRLVERRNDWGVLPIDLRGHGDSEPGEPPHTIQGCTDDLLTLPKAGTPDADAVLGHSFGGKVAIVLAAQAPSVRHLVVVDSTPSVREPSGSAWKMLGVLRRNPGPFPDRRSGIAAVEAEGWPGPVAQWMGTNLVSDEGAAGSEAGWRWRLDPDQMEMLLRDFFALDAWPSLRAAAERGVRVDLLRATGSSVVSSDDREALAALRREGLPVHLTEVEGGHWLNADNPDRMVELLAERLPHAPG